MGTGFLKSLQPYNKKSPQEKPMEEFLNIDSNPWIQASWMYPNLVLNHFSDSMAWKTSCTNPQIGFETQITKKQRKQLKETTIEWNQE